MIRNARRSRLLDNEPSPEEIRQLTEDIRRGWSPRELDRRASYRPVAWLPPVFAATQLPQGALDADVNPYG